VTAPDGKRIISVLKIRPSDDWQNGLLEETRTVTTNTSGQAFVWSKKRMYWEQGTDLSAGRDNPRL
jgi:hypothetical protein